MDCKYAQDNIPRVITEVIFENKKQNKNQRLHYREIHRRVEQLLSHPISDRQLLKNLSGMVCEKLLNRNDPTGKRGSKVHFSLTEKAKRKYHLNMLGTGKEVIKHKSLYQLLIFFEAYKRRRLLTEKQLAKFLKQIGSSIDYLEKVQDVNLFENIAKTIFKPINGVEIAGFPQYDPKTKSAKTWYYTVIPGFTVKEFYSYLRKVKKGKDPRPFSRFFPRLYIPFINYQSYSSLEVKDGINLLKEDGLIKPIDEIFPGEIRYDISNELLKNLVRDIWFIIIIDFYLFVGRLLFKGKPTESDKNNLGLFFGKRVADGMIAEAYSIRHSHKNHGREREQEFIREMDNYKRSLFHGINETYKQIISEDEIARELVQEISFSPFEP